MKTTKLSPAIIASVRLSNDDVVEVVSMTGRLIEQCATRGAALALADRISKEWGNRVHIVIGGVAFDREDIRAELEQSLCA